MEGFSIIAEPYSKRIKEDCSTPTHPKTVMLVPCLFHENLACNSKQQLFQSRHPSTESMYRRVADEGLVLSKIQSDWERRSVKAVVMEDEKSRIRDSQNKCGWVL